MAEESNSGTSNTPKPVSDALDVEEQQKSEPITNPLVGSLNVTVSVPETIQIKIVDASVLADYEIWFFISSVLASAVVGFLVAFIQDTSKLALLAMTGVWVVLFVIALVMTLTKRGRLRRKSKEITLRASQVSTDDL